MNGEYALVAEAFMSLLHDPIPPLLCNVELGGPVCLFPPQSAPYDKESKGLPNETFEASFSRILWSLESLQVYECPLDALITLLCPWCSGYPWVTAALRHDRHNGNWKTR